MAIGGWGCLGGCPPSRARWFRVALSRDNAPWAFCRGEPFRTIASIELFASLVSLIVFSDKWRSQTKGKILLSGQTDNLGNTSVLSKLMSSKFPLVVFMTELASRLRSMDLDLSLDWIPRNQNEEADGITNGNVQIFDPAQEIIVDIKGLNLRTLDRMWLVADDLYKEVQGNRGRQRDQPMPTEKGRPGVDSRPLRERDPW